MTMMKCSLITDTTSSTVVKVARSSRGGSWDGGVVGGDIKINELG